MSRGQEPAATADSASVPRPRAPDGSRSEKCYRAQKWARARGPASGRRGPDGACRPRSNLSISTSCRLFEAKIRAPAPVKRCAGHKNNLTSLRAIAIAIAHKTARRSPALRRPDVGATHWRSVVFRPRTPAQVPDGQAQCRESPPAGHSRESHRALWQRRNRTCPCGCGNKTAAHGWPCAALASGLKRAPATRCPVPAPWRGTEPGAPGRGRARASVSRARESVPVSDWRRGARSSTDSPCLDRGASAGDARPSQAGTRAVHGHMDVPLGAIGESHRVPARVLPCPPPLDSGRARKMKMPSRAQSMPGRYPVESRRGGRPGPARDTGGGAWRAGPRFPVASCRPSRNRLASIRPATRRTRIATAPTASSRQRADIDHKPVRTPDAAPGCKDRLQPRNSRQGSRPSNHSRAAPHGPGPTGLP